MKKKVFRERYRKANEEYVYVIGETPVITAYDSKKSIQEDIEETRLKVKKVRKTKGDK